MTPPNADDGLGIERLLSISRQLKDQSRRLKSTTWSRIAESAELLLASRNLLSLVWDVQGRECTECGTAVRASDATVVIGSPGRRVHVACLRHRLRTVVSSPGTRPENSGGRVAPAEGIERERPAAMDSELGADPAGCHAHLRRHAEGAEPAISKPCRHALDRVQSVVALEKSAALTDAVLAALPNETAVVDATGTILHVNAAWARAARSAPAHARRTLRVGGNYLDACRSAIDMPADVAWKVHGSLEAILRGEVEEFALEYPMTRGGRDCWLEVRVHRLQHLSGGAAVIRSDVTVRHRAETTSRRDLSQMAHLDRVAGMGQLAASIAHELNQPLTAILTNAQAASRLLSSSEPDLAELRACLADIISDDRRAAEVLRHMRRLLRKTEVVSLPLALNDLITATIALVANDAMLHAVTIDFAPAPALPVCSGDLVQIQQVILNLLGNAIMAAVSGPSLARTVNVWTTAMAGPYVEIGVHDSGAGIARDDLDRLFEPFFTTKAEGLGMGLAISRRIVEAHGGRILAENDRAGGATFRVHLPTDRATTT